MLKIRLMRIGAKRRPYYRVVAVDERAKRTGGYLELLGTYNPLTNPHEVKLKQERIDILVKQGAQMSDGFLRIIGQAPQRPPRKPKKAKVEPKVKEESNPSTSSGQEESVSQSEEPVKLGEDENPDKIATPSTVAQDRDDQNVAEADSGVTSDETPQNDTYKPEPEVSEAEAAIESSDEFVIASEAKQSSSDENPNKIATNPSDSRNDNNDSEAENTQQEETEDKEKSDS